MRGAAGGPAREVKLRGYAGLRVVFSTRPLFFAFMHFFWPGVERYRLTPHNPACGIQNGPSGDLGVAVLALA